MMHRFFKIGKVSCHIVSDTSHFKCKIRVPAISMACPYRLHAVSGHHSLKDQPRKHVKKMDMSIKYGVAVG